MIAFRTQGETGTRQGDFPIHHVFLASILSYGRIKVKIPEHFLRDLHFTGAAFQERKAPL